MHYDLITILDLDFGTIVPWELKQLLKCLWETK